MKSDALLQVKGILYAVKSRIKIVMALIRAGFVGTLLSFLFDNYDVICRSRD